ncbi:hypothetical protein BT63DRAFT_452263 [Microthyrium microscopicum]|uniref:Uncharacterized protein n=1 Tax=Microthyrium microscopicum TaxID=703497 RepID=A0A6A6UJW2_9PEZI|nr:hypothetical protein BT63DRAFT_452263 [Microthyrium microscopicum]
MKQKPKSVKSKAPIKAKRAKQNGVAKLVPQTGKKDPITAQPTQHKRRPRRNRREEQLQQQWNQLCVYRKALSDILLSLDDRSLDMATNQLDQMTLTEPQTQKNNIKHDSDYEEAREEMDFGDSVPRAYTWFINRQSPHLLLTAIHKGLGHELLSSTPIDIAVGDGSKHDFHLVVEDYPSEIIFMAIHKYNDEAKLAVTVEGRVQIQLSVDWIDDRALQAVCQHLEEVCQISGTPDRGHLKSSPPEIDALFEWEKIFRFFGIKNLAMQQTISKQVKHNEVFFLRFTNRDEVPGYLKSYWNNLVQKESFKEKMQMHEFIDDEDEDLEEAEKDIAQIRDLARGYSGERVLYCIILT